MKEISLETLYSTAEFFVSQISRKIEIYEGSGFEVREWKKVWLRRSKLIHITIDMTLTRCAGVARNTGEVKLSYPIFRLPENYVEYEDTVLHEIAHVLVGCENKHSHRWKTACSVIGCTGNVYHNMENLPRLPELDKDQQTEKLRRQISDLDECFKGYSVSSKHLREWADECNE